MHVPEAAVYKDDFASRDEDEIGPSGERLNVKRVTKPHSVNCSPHAHFRRGIFRSNRAHTRFSLFS